MWEESEIFTWVAKIRKVNRTQEIVPVIKPDLRLNGSHFSCSRSILYFLFNVLFMLHCTLNSVWHTIKPFFTALQRWKKCLFLHHFCCAKHQNQWIQFNLFTIKHWLIVSMNKTIFIFSACWWIATKKNPYCIGYNDVGSIKRHSKRLKSIQVMCWMILQNFPNHTHKPSEASLHTIQITNDFQEILILIHDARISFHRSISRRHHPLYTALNAFKFRLSINFTMIAFYVSNKSSWMTEKHTIPQQNKSEQKTRVYSALKWDYLNEINSSLSHARDVHCSFCCSHRILHIYLVLMSMSFSLKTQWNAEKWNRNNK